MKMEAIDHDDPPKSQDSKRRLPFLYKLEVGDNAHVELRLFVERVEIADWEVESPDGGLVLGDVWRHQLFEN